MKFRKKPKSEVDTEAAQILLRFTAPLGPSKSFERNQKCLTFGSTRHFSFLEKRLTLEHSAAIDIQTA
jgi:hypothetical protein